VLFKEKALSFTFILSIFNLVIAIPFFFFVDFSKLTSSGLVVLFIKSLLEAGSFFCIMLGIKNLELSRALPLLVLTPGLVAISAFIFIGESLTNLEILGIVLLTIGTYIFSLNPKQKIKGPFKEVIKPKGIYYIILALAIFTATGVLDKVILNKFNVSINSFMGFQHLFLAAIFLTTLIFTKERKILVPTFKRSWSWILLVAFITITYRYTYLQAVKVAPVALALSLKRISVFFAVLIGGKLFNEHSLFKKSIATIILIAGALLIING
jgi:uncharacterized membrane protein